MIDAKRYVTDQSDGKASSPTDTKICDDDRC